MRGRERRVGRKGRKRGREGSGGEGREGEGKNELTLVANSWLRHWQQLVTWHFYHFVHWHQNC